MEPPIILVIPTGGTTTPTIVWVPTRLLLALESRPQSFCAASLLSMNSLVLLILLEVQVRCASLALVIQTGPTPSLFTLRVTTVVLVSSCCPPVWI